MTLTQGAKRPRQSAAWTIQSGKILKEADSETGFVGGVIDKTDQENAAQQHKGQNLRTRFGRKVRSHPIELKLKTRRIHDPHSPVKD